MRSASVCTVLFMLAMGTMPSSVGASPAGGSSTGAFLLPAPALCGPRTGPLVPTEPGAPGYYAVELVPTGRVPGTRTVTGQAVATFPDNAFGLQLGSDGQYVYDLEVIATDLPTPGAGVYAVWLTTPRLDRIAYLGALDATLRLRGRVPWNKFLVVVTLEPAASELSDTWTGPVVMRGMSRSGRMHTMAGHGPYQTEPCAVYGY